MQSVLKCLLGLLLVTALHAEEMAQRTVSVVGSAEMMLTDVKQSRQNAIADALRQAETTLGMYIVYSEIREDQRVAAENQLVRSTHNVANYRVIKEWRDSQSYYVELIVDGIQKATIQPVVNKKITLLQFDGKNTLQLDDIRNAYSEFPKNIASRLEENGGFISAYLNGRLPKEQEQIRPLVIKIAQDTGAQFVVSGTVSDASISQGKRFWNAPTRHFGLSITVYDGLSGAKLNTFLLEQEASGNVEIGWDKNFASGSFFETDSGKVIKKLINLSADKIAATVECLPLSMRIIRVDNKAIYLDAGATSKLETGDKLTVYATGSHFPLAPLGAIEEPIASITLLKVQPLFSTAEITEKLHDTAVQAGNIARLNVSDTESGKLSCFK